MYYRAIAVGLFFAAAFGSTATAADLLLGNVKGYSLDSTGALQQFTAILVSDGKVVTTGNDIDLARISGKARHIDGKGQVLLPGLTDAHGHVMGLGELRSQIDLSGSNSLDEALAAIKKYAAQHRKLDWIVGRGWNQEIWKLGRFPNSAELDDVEARRPVWLERVDGHAGWANSAALARAGIDRDTRDPTGGRIERTADGTPSGVLVDAAMELVSKVVPARTRAERSASLDAALLELASLGVTSVHDAGIDNATFDLYKKYADAHKLTTRIYAMIGATDADFERISRRGPLIGYRGDFLTVRSVKLYADGALGSRGAALLAPYSDAPAQRGLLFHSAEQITAMISKALSRGYQVNVHAIGDGANRQVLDAFASAYITQPDGRALRNRIEHAQVLALEDIPRFVQLNLIASLQPTHATSDMNMAEDRIGAARIRGAYAWQRFLQQGSVVAAGSDFPVESANPFYGLHAAITRQDHAGKPAGGWYPDQAMSRIQAFRAFTLDAAWAAHQEDHQGSLQPGRWADFILVDRDPFNVDATQIWSTRVNQTWVGGKLVYERAQ